MVVTIPMKFLLKSTHKTISFAVFDKKKTRFVIAVKVCFGIFLGM